MRSGVCAHCCPLVHIYMQHSAYMCHIDSCLLDINIKSIIYHYNLTAWSGSQRASIRSPNPPLPIRRSHGIFKTGIAWNESTSFFLRAQQLQLFSKWYQRNTIHFTFHLPRRYTEKRTPRTRLRRRIRQGDTFSPTFVSIGAPGRYNKLFSHLGVRNAICSTSRSLSV